MLHFRGIGPVLALLLAGCSFGQDGPATEQDTGQVAAEEVAAVEPIRIGVVLDITGAGASLGTAERDALVLLARETNAEGGVDGRPVELDVRDNQSTPEAAAAEVGDLLAGGVDIVLGASRTTPSLAMRPLVEQAQVPMISMAANQAIVEGADWVFKTAQNDRVVVQRIHEYMQRQGYTTLGLARDSSAFGAGIADFFRGISGDPGIVVVEERFAPDATEFSAQMESLRAAGADLNVIWGIPPAAGTATAAYRQLGLEAPLVHSHGIGNRVFLEVAGEAANGVVFPIGRMLVSGELPADDPQREVITEFVELYSTEYGQPPSTFAGHAYDAYNLALLAFSEVGTDPFAVRGWLETAQFTGVSGIYRMSPRNHSGLGADALIYAEVRDGEFTLVE